MTLDTIARPTSHLIFEDVNGSFIFRGMIPFIADDPNQGLPDEFFDGQFVSFELDNEGNVEWVPACGPAPCWKARYASFNDHAEMINTWLIWLKETY